MESIFAYMEGYDYETMSSLIRISREEGIPTYRAADLLAERRIEAVRKAKLLAAHGDTRM